MGAAEGIPAVRQRVAGRLRHGVAKYGRSGLVVEAVTRPLRPLLAPAAGRRLRRQAALAMGDTNRLVELAFGFDAFGIAIAPGQSRWEISRLVEELAERRCRRVLEIGTATGGSLFLFAQVAAPDAHVISVDLRHGEFGGGYPGWRTPLYRGFRRERQRLDLIRGDSHAAATSQRVRDLLAGEPLDFLFIDGDHTYEGVRADFELYGPLVGSGGLIGFHDIAPPTGPRPEGGPTLLGGDVPEFWQSLTATHQTRELIDPAGGGYFGIGLVTP